MQFPGISRIADQPGSVEVGAVGGVAVAAVVQLGLVAGGGIEALA